MKKIDFDILINIKGEKLKTKTTGYFFTPHLAVTHPFKRLTGWIIIDLKSGTPIYTKPQPTTEKAKAYFYDNFENKYAEYITTNFYEKQVRRFESMKAVNI